MEPKSIKEIKELFAALKVMAQVGGAVAKDGKIGTDDIQHLVSFGVQFQSLINGFSGLAEALAEAKDLDKSEVIEIIGLAYDVVKAFEDSKK